MRNAVNDKNRIIGGCVAGRLFGISPALYNSQIIGQDFLNLISFWIQCPQLNRKESSFSTISQAERGRPSRFAFARILFNRTGSLSRLSIL